MKIKRTIQIAIAIIILCTYSLVQAKECKHTFDSQGPFSFIYSENETMTLRFMRIGFRVSSDSITEIYKIELNGTRKQFIEKEIENRWTGWAGVIYYRKDGTWNAVEYQRVKVYGVPMNTRELWRKPVKLNELPVQFPPELLKFVHTFAVYPGPSNLTRIDILTPTSYCDTLELYDYLIRRNL